MKTDIDYIRELIQTYVPIDAQDLALETLIGIEGTFRTYELPYGVRQLLAELESTPELNGKQIIQIVQAHLPALNDAGKQYLTRGGNPTVKLRVVGRDVYFLLNMLEAVGMNRNYLEDGDASTLIENLSTWLHGRVSSINKKCGCGVSSCRNCESPFKDEDDNAVWRCPNCQALRPMCKSPSLLNGRCLFHGGKNSETTVTYAEVSQTLREKYLKGTRRETLNEIMKDPEAALSNAHDVYLLEVRMMELMDRLGDYQLNESDIATLEEIKAMSDSPEIVDAINHLVAVVYERQDDEKTWEMINDQALKLNTLRVGQSSILRNTQNALSSAQKRDMSQKLIAIIQLSISEATTQIQPLIEAGAELSEIKLQLANNMTQVIKRNI